MTFIFDLLSLTHWNFTPFSWGIFCLTVFIVGFSKTGIPGITIIAVPMMAMIVPAKESVGVMLPIFMLADVISVWSYWRSAKWSYCFPYLAFVGLGVWGASYIVGTVENKTFTVIIGWSVLLLIFLSVAADVVLKNKKRADLPAAEKPPLVMSMFFGLAAGLFSALANAAGPIVSLYMILSRLEKFQFLGTTAVCAFAMNWIKIPLFVSLGSINAATLKLGAAAIPAVLLGGVAGIFFARKLPQKAFKNIVLALAFLASLKLIVG